MTLKELLTKLEKYDFLEDELVFIKDENSGELYEIRDIYDFSSFTQYPDGTKSPLKSGITITFDFQPLTQSEV